MALYPDTTWGVHAQVGDNILSQRGLANQEYQRWLAIGVLIFAWVFFNLCTWFFLSFLSGAS